MSRVVKRLCPRTAELAQPIAGAVIRECDFCGASVWLDPLQHNPYPDLKQVLICTPCGRADDEVAPFIKRIESDPVYRAEQLAQEKARRIGGGG